ncbi:hypothetical protein PG994_015364 [Apiospora phragmitis]|uniref:Uncharacterized protein n=1 Tax=Apiospora phragmitis TaxID=2905665 RepID=A0ABR1SRD1_9PEZI
MAPATCRNGCVGIQYTAYSRNASVSGIVPEETTAAPPGALVDLVHRGVHSVDVFILNLFLFMLLLFTWLYCIVSGQVNNASSRTGIRPCKSRLRFASLASR